MKHLITIPFFVLFAILRVNATDSNQTEKIKAQKIAFITERIGLSPVDAQKFWPVYNELSHKKDSLHDLRNRAKKIITEKGQKLTAKQKEEAIDIQINTKIKEAELSKQYHEKFKKILTIEQVIKLYDAEHEFKMLLIKQISGKEACGDCNTDGKQQLASGKP
jgi:hypothetical protein